MSSLSTLLQAMRSRRTAAVVLQSFASGLPLGLVWNAIPDWMRDIGVDIRVVGLITLAQAPWTFKVLWAPLIDRYVPPFWGRRRGWMALMQVALFALGLAMAGLGERPEAVWVVGALALGVALASATHDIAIDAYAVEVLDRHEQGATAGLRTASYRGALMVAGGLSISLAARIGWPAVNVLLACLYLPVLALTWWSPEPDVPIVPPRSMREAVWAPLVSFLARPRALEILAFVVLYKLSDQLTQSLTRPFLVDMGYGPDERGIALATIGVAGFVGGALVGGWLTTIAGLGHALWGFGFLQLFSNLGYLAIAMLDHPNVPAMFGATGFEFLTSGMGSGAFSVLLMRLTERRFSATQYALFSSLFALPRVLAGPVTGFTVDAVGWPAFYVVATVIGVPGLLMLGRFVPFGVAEVDLERDDAAAVSDATPRRMLSVPSVLAGLAVALGAALLVAVVNVLQAARGAPDQAIALGPALVQLVTPVDASGWLSLGGVATCGVVGGLLVAALRAPRS